MSPDLQHAWEHMEVLRAIPAWVIPAVIAVAGQMFGGGSSSGAGGSGGDGMTPEMRRMLALEESRLLAQRPLYNNVLAMANRMLPLWARANNGMAPGGAQPAASPEGVFPGMNRDTNKPGGVPGGPGGGVGQKDTTQPYGGWQPPGY